MKIISLNIWVLSIKEPLLKFLETNKDTDVFCFQEVFSNHKNGPSHVSNQKADYNALQTIEKVLTDHVPYFCPIDDMGTYGIAIFVKKGIEVLDNGSIFVYQNPSFDKNNEESGDHNRKMQWVMLSTKNNEKLLVMNLHGYWTRSKDDTPERITQSKTINSFVENHKDIKQILVGDFNLDINTESIKILEKNFRNLVKENNIQSTRTLLYTHKGGSQFADYAFVNKEIDIKDFKVLPDEVSDHSPLFLAIDLLSQ
jgi:endonuclease/exonuclease/phosphatase family metal-dependent hydrolase